MLFGSRMYITQLNFFLDNFFSVENSCLFENWMSERELES